MRPYLGSVPQHRPGFRSRWYGSDSPDQAKSLGLDPTKEELGWQYSFNSLGFRGEEFDPSADFTIFTSGCSDTFGEGVPLEKIWPEQLKAMFAIERKSISILNLAQSGASNEYIARSLVSQVQASPPKLVIALFAQICRFEHLKDKTVHNLGPWREDQVSLDFYAHYTEENGLAALLRHIHTVQASCKAHSVPFVFGCIDFRKVLTLSEHSNPVLRQLASFIDWSNFLPGSPHSAGDDRGREGIHPGPQSHRRYAEEVFKFLEKDLSA